MRATLIAAAAMSPAAPVFAETNITFATDSCSGCGFVVTETLLDQSSTTHIRALGRVVEGTIWFAPG